MFVNCQSKGRYHARGTSFPVVVVVCSQLPILAGQIKNIKMIESESTTNIYMLIGCCCLFHLLNIFVNANFCYWLLAEVERYTPLQIYTNPFYLIPTLWNIGHLWQTFWTRLYVWCYKQFLSSLFSYHSAFFFECINA